MPRKRKTEIDHDKVSPLSLPEVQLAVASSLDGDKLNTDRVQRALQGYLLLLQGSLRNSLSETTKTLDGQGGYYTNLMRGVAHAFGLKKRDDEQEILSRDAFSSDSDSGLSFLQLSSDPTRGDTSPVLKKIKTSHREDMSTRAAQNQSSAEREDDQPVVSAMVEMDKHNNQIEVEEKRLDAAQSDDFGGSQLLPDLPDRASNDQAALQLEGQKITDIRLISNEVQANENTSSPAPNTTQQASLSVPNSVIDKSSDPSTTTFIRYKRRGIPASTTEHADGTTTALDVVLPENNTDAGIHQSSSNTRTQRDIGISQTADKPTINTSKTDTEDISANQTTRKRGRSPPSVTKSPGPIDSNANNAGIPRNSENVEDSGGIRSKRGLEYFAQEEMESKDILRSDRVHDNIQESHPAKDMTDPKANNGSTLDDHGDKITDSTIDKKTSTTHRDTPETTKHSTVLTPQNFSTNALKPEDIKDIADDMASPPACTVLSDVRIMGCLEEALLPGTWMTSNKYLHEADLQSPEKTELCTILRHAENNATKVPCDDWQVVVFRDLKHICEIAVSNQDVHKSRLLESPVIFVLENYPIGVNKQLCLAIFNFINGCLRKHHRAVRNIATPSRKDFERIKTISRAVCKKLCCVTMPKPPRNTLKIAYLLSNVSYIMNAKQKEILFSKVKSITTLGIKKDYMFGSGKKRVSISFQYTEVSMSLAYNSTYVEPLLAL